MGFGSGSGDDPFEEDTGGEIEEATTGESQNQATTMDAGSPPVDDSSPAEQTNRQDPSTNNVLSTSDRTATESVSESGTSPPKFSEVEVTDHHSTRELAQMLMAQEYHKENPRVPYATWRTGTSTGRSRTTIELNSEVDDLVKEARREFEDRYDAEINKADLREFALVYGLMHVDDVFEMAEEWGLQYNG